MFGLIFATIISEEKEGDLIYKRDLINEAYICQIYINEKEITNNYKLQKVNNIVYIFQKKYNYLSNMFKSCSLLTTINLENIDTNEVLTTKVCLKIVHL